MDFTYDDEQQALREAVRGLLASTYADHETRRRGRSLGIGRSRRRHARFDAGRT